MTNPWWYSGSDQLGQGESERRGEQQHTSENPRDEHKSSASGSHDLLSMLSGAQRMVTWAADAVMASHADHEDPRDHPQCLMCRGTLLLGEVGLPGFGPHEPGDVVAEGVRMAGSAPAMEVAEPITWIPVRR